MYSGLFDFRILTTALRSDLILYAFPLEEARIFQEIYIVNLYIFANLQICTF